MVPGPDHIRLADAMLCSEATCQTVFALPTTQCPACTSEQSVPLAVILDANGNRALTEGLRAMSKHVTIPNLHPRKRKETP